MPSVSVIVIARNEERNIAECLASASWVQEAIVVDSGSTDRTVVVAAAAGAKVFEQPWEGFGAAKNFAMSQATGDWILWLDADERLTPELTNEMKNALHDVKDAVSGFDMPRRANFLGKWIMHSGWYPGRATRLFRKSRGQFSSHRVHERLELDGSVESLKNDLLHYTDPNLHHYYEKFNRYTTLAAEELEGKGSRFRLTDLLIRPMWLFIRMFVLKRGFLDGIPGFILAASSASYVFVKYSKLWELQEAKEND